MADSTTDTDRKVLYDKRSEVAYITLNRPEAKNAIDFDMHERLGQIWADFRDDQATIESAKDIALAIVGRRLDDALTVEALLGYGVVASNPTIPERLGNFYDRTDAGRVGSGQERSTTIERRGRVAVVTMTTSDAATWPPLRRTSRKP